VLRYVKSLTIDLSYITDHGLENLLNSIENLGLNGCENTTFKMIDRMKYRLVKVNDLTISITDNDNEFLN
jgi:hypothetical protein